MSSSRRRDDRLFHPRVHGCFLGRDEAGAHVDAFGAHGQRAHQASPVGHTAGCDERDLQLVGRPRKQNEVRNVVFSRVPAALEAVDTESIDPESFRLQGVPDRGAFVDHLDAGLLEGWQPFLRVVAGRFDDLDPTVQNRADVAGIVGRRDGRKERDVHPKRLVRQFMALADFLGQPLEASAE